MEIDDNLLASFIDGTITPLEKQVFSKEIKARNEEVLDIVSDIKDSKHFIDQMEPIKIPECEKFIDSINKNWEMKNNVESPKHKML